MKDKDALVAAASTPLTAPQGLGFEEDAGQGFENADKDSYALPFLRIIQSNSPQVNPADGAFIAGSTQGMLFETIGNTLFTAKEGVRVVPVHFDRTFAEFEIREKGGGFRGNLTAEEAAHTATTLDDKSRAITARGTQLVDTRNHYVLLLVDGAIKPALICLTSTQMKKSRRWMTLMDSIKFQRADGSFYTPPVFSHIYRVTTVSENNEKGSWHGFRIENEGVLTDPVIYATAKKLRESIRLGQIKAPAPMPEGASETGIPF